MIKINSDQTRFFDYYEDEIITEESEFVAIFERRAMCRTEINLGNRIS